MKNKAKDFIENLECQMNQVKDNSLQQFKLLKEKLRVARILLNSFLKVQKKKIVGLTQRMELIARAHAVYERLLHWIPLTLKLLCSYLHENFEIYSKNENILIKDSALYKNILGYRSNRVGKI